MKFLVPSPRLARLGAPGPGRAVPGVTVGLLLTSWMLADDASAASLGSAASAGGMVLVIATLLLYKGWQSHLIVGGLSTFAGLVALCMGVVLLWRSGVAGNMRRLSVFGAAAVADSVAAFAVKPVALPAGLEHEVLLDELRRHFHELQAAWDQRARDSMSLLTTPEMLEELWAVLCAGPGTHGVTEVVSLQAELLLFEEREAAQVVCVDFSGLLRESPSQDAAPFREFWMLTRPRDASRGWRLARQQALL